MPSLHESARRQEDRTENIIPTADVGGKNTCPIFQHPKSGIFRHSFLTIEKIHFWSIMIFIIYIFYVVMVEHKH